ncbi:MULTISPECIES: hypothetical protein [unclassified Microcoleus]|uniref:hypothetical protein n=1 Tax=unclassified Microcoleus TaxID=2642155 RepID=UPI002FD182F8
MGQSLMLWGASHLCSPPLEIGVLRQEAGGRRKEAEGKRQKERGRRKEAEGKRQKEGARRSIFTNMRCSHAVWQRREIYY